MLTASKLSRRLEGVAYWPTSRRDRMEICGSPFPDIHYTVEELVAEGDTVVARVTVSDTHRGPFQGIPP